MCPWVVSQVAKISLRDKNHRRGAVVVSFFQRVWLSPSVRKMYTQRKYGLVVNNVLATALVWIYMPLSSCAG